MKLKNLIYSICLPLLFIMASCGTKRLGTNSDPALAGLSFLQEALLVNTARAGVDTTPAPVRKTMPLRYIKPTHERLFDEETWQGRLQMRLDTLCNQDLFASTQLGLCVFDLTDSVMLYSVGATQRMRPASNMKLVTAITALDVLGADYTYVPTVQKPGWGWCWDDAETGITDFGAKGTRKSKDLLYAETRSRSVADVLVPMMKNSDNLLAESMFWQLPDSTVASPTRRHCAAKVEQLVERLGLDPSVYVFADGSGVSLYDYLSPQLLLTLLQYAYSTNSIYANLYVSLPIAGVDGTLRNRMKDTPAQGNVHAKTGTVTGVSSLSGYCTHPSGHQLCFSIINQGIPSASVGRSFQDQVCVVLTSK